MRIAEVASVATPVGPQGSGSIEGMVWTLSSGLARLGHDVTVFGVAGSTGPGKVVVTMPGSYDAAGVPEDWRVAEFVHVARALERSADFDIIHSHGYLYGMPLAPLCAAQLVHTLHVMPTPEWVALARLYPGAAITALSEYQWSGAPDVRPAAVIPHAAGKDAFSFRAQPDGYLAYLGRFTPGKGVVLAIKCARALGLPIRLAGWQNDYFDAEVAPLLDGDSVRYVGPVSGDGRDEFLGRALVLVYPITAPEPFGMVLVEAMACGTPVAAFGVGAVTEIVDEGVTGATTRPGGDLEGAVGRAVELDRAGVADRARHRFEPEGMARSYERLFERLLSPSRPTKPSGQPTTVIPSTGSAAPLMAAAAGRPEARHEVSCSPR